jgi:hypothetical protein
VTKREGKPPLEAYPLRKAGCAPLGLASVVLRQHIEDHRCLGLIVYLQFQLVTDVEVISGAFDEEHKFVAILYFSDELFPSISTISALMVSKSSVASIRSPSIMPVRSDRRKAC